MAKTYPIEDTIIDLNVGGQYFSTYKTTLCKYEDSMIATMFSGRLEDNYI
jgi:hypothetical protein